MLTMRFLLVTIAYQADQRADLWHAHDAVSTPNSHALETVEQRDTRFEADSQCKML